MSAPDDFPPTFLPYTGKKLFLHSMDSAIASVGNLLRSICLALDLPEWSMTVVLCSPQDRVRLLGSDVAARVEQGRNMIKTVVVDMLTVCLWEICRHEPEVVDDTRRKLAINFRRYINTGRLSYQANPFPAVVDSMQTSAPYRELPTTGTTKETWLPVIVELASRFRQFHCMEDDEYNRLLFEHATTRGHGAASSELPPSAFEDDPIALLLVLCFVGIAVKCGMEVSNTRILESLKDDAQAGGRVLTLVYGSPERVVADKSVKEELKQRLAEGWTTERFVYALDYHQNHTPQQTLDRTHVWASTLQRVNKGLHDAGFPQFASISRLRVAYRHQTDKYCKALATANGRGVQAVPRWTQGEGKILIDFVQANGRGYDQLTELTKLVHKSRCGITTKYQQYLRGELTPLDGTNADTTWGPASGEDDGDEAMADAAFPEWSEWNEY